MLEFVKNYLRVDDGEDELLEVLIESAKEYIINAVGYFNEEIYLMKLLTATLCTEWYEKRGFTDDKSFSVEKKVIVKSMLMQLKKYKIKEDDKNVSEQVKQ